MLGGTRGRRRREQQRLDGITDLMDVSLSELRELVINREAWHAVIHGVTESDMTEPTCTLLLYRKIFGPYESSVCFMYHLTGLSLR